MARMGNISHMISEQPAIRDDPVLRSAYDWRLPGSIIALENFDFPRLHRSGEFSRERLSLLIRPRMAGSAIERSPDELRALIRAGVFCPRDKGYLHGLFGQFDRFQMRCFMLHAGISAYELARAMIASKVHDKSLTLWMNRHSPQFEGEDVFQRIWDIDFKI